MSQKQPHCGFVAIVGRPNVGKSTLLNQILKKKISITSKKPQTTRHCIIGIHTEDEYQIIYIDTPGLQIKERWAINFLMNKVGFSFINDVELVIFVVEGVRWNDDDQIVLNTVKSFHCPVILAINKIDNISDKTVLLPYISFLNKKMNFFNILLMSAEKYKGIDMISKIVRRHIPEANHYFPNNYTTDHSQRFMASEIIREKLMRFLGDELPYCVVVKIKQLKMIKQGIFYINALILVKRASQKKIIIGNKGTKLKKIGTEARIDIEILFDAKVYLALWVKVTSGWVDDEATSPDLDYINNLK
ncbi:GTPase Era [Candidatus Hartigia pinicola]|nr:GTPase Era [Candidatus Hartigia pinicola]